MAFVMLSRARMNLRTFVLLASALSAACGSRTPLLVGDDTPAVGAPLDAGTAGKGAGADGGFASDAPAPQSVKVDAVTAGPTHACARLSNGAVMCWGSDAYGQLGDSGNTSKVTKPIFVPGITNAIDLSAGYQHTCAVTSDGSVLCWGDDMLGQISGGRGKPQMPATRIELGNRRAISVSAGFMYTCAAFTSGEVACWGVGDHGQLGDGLMAERSKPVFAKGITDAIAVGANDYRTCAFRKGGAISCWGDSNLGDGSVEASATPVTVKGLMSKPTEMAVGGMHSCALIDSGNVECWGYGGYGELGFGPATASLELPLSVPGVVNARSVSASENGTCVALADGTVWRWGDDSAGFEGTFAPDKVAGLSDAVKVTGGLEFGCALRANARVSCWGENGSGQIGDGTTTFRASAVDVIGLP